MMKKIRILTTATPLGSPGDEVMVPNKQADVVVASGHAEYVRKERAIKDRRETR